MGVWIMAGATLREGARKKLLWIALAAGLGFLAFFATGLHFQMEAITARNMSPVLRREVVNTMLTMGLYAIDLLAVVMTVLISVDTLAGEISSGTIQAIATKPVPRWQLLLGKWLGLALIMLVFIAIMMAGINEVTYFMGGVTARHAFRGYALICLESLLLLALTFRFGASFSTLTNGVLVLGLHGVAFIGGWIEQAGALTHSERAVNVGIVASIIMPTEALWRRAAFEMQSPMAAALHISPFTNDAIPSAVMVGYAALYMSVALLLAVRRFGQRDF